jgi:hypothetical protein
MSPHLHNVKDVSGIHCQHWKLYFHSTFSEMFFEKKWQRRWAESRTMAVLECIEFPLLF